MVSSPNSGRVDPFDAAVDVVGDQWSFLLMREAFFGVRRFGQFAESLAIPRARLTERLQHLVTASIFERRRYQERPPRSEYRFTGRGLDIYPIALTLMAWGDRWRNDPGAGPRVRLVHVPCGKRLRPHMSCSECGEAPTADTTVWPTYPHVESPVSPVVRWRRLESFGEVSQRNDSVAKSLEAIGDRWSMKVIHRVMRGSSRFTELQEELGIATNTLSDRLHSLSAEEVLARGPGTGRGSTGYALTKSGAELAPVMLAVRAWGARWLTARRSKPLRHTACGRPFEPVCVCAACREVVDARQVRVQAPGR